NLCHQAVADGEQRVSAPGLREGHVVLQHADQQATNDIYPHDDQPGHRIAAHEFAGTIHRTVEIGFGGHLGTAPACLLLTDQAGIEIRVDGHLLAGHGVEHEA